MPEYNIIDLWNELTELGLLNPEVRNWRDLKGFGFDCNRLGDMKTTKDPKKILALILFIRENYSTKPNQRHVHQELLGQCALREELDQEYVRWGRYHHMNISEGIPRSAFIFLGEWLAENGHPYPYDDK